VRVALIAIIVCSLVGCSAIVAGDKEIKRARALAQRVHF
jgi:uncharacterized protein YceK